MTTQSDDYVVQIPEDEGAEKPEAPGVGTADPFGEIAYTKGRAVLGWLTDVEATHALLGHAPGPTDVLAPITAMIAAARAAVAARAAYEPQPAIVPIDDPRIAAASIRPELKAEFWGMDWSVGFVDLREVLTFQKFVSVEGLEARVAAAAADSEAL